MYKSENAISLLEELPIKKLYLVDPYVVYKEWSSASSRTMNERGCEKMMNDALDVIKDYTDKFEFIRKFSHEATRDIPNDLDFVYIDGNHDPMYVINDIKKYKRKLKKGGVIGGHDYHRIKVRNAVHSILPHVYWDVGDWWYIV